jgi:hypothetical protein
MHEYTVTGWIRVLLHISSYTTSILLHSYTTSILLHSYTTSILLHSYTTSILLHSYTTSAVPTIRIISLYRDVTIF